MFRIAGYELLNEQDKSFVNTKLGKEDTVEKYELKKIKFDD
jgi:hypothetical protein